MGARVSEFSSSVLRLQGRRRRSVARWFACCGALLVLGGCSGAEHLSFLNPQGPIAAAESEHFWIVVAILFIFVALPVFVGTVWIAWRYRYGVTGPKYTPRWKFYKPLEFFTWGGPIVIVIILSVLVWRNTERYDPYRAIASSAPPLHVQVIGYDWKWLFVYPDQGIASVGVLAFPSGRPVSMELTSATVMQSFFIPALAGQIYAMGGMVTQLNLEAAKPGRFLGENTMYNGNGFHQQKFAAVAMTPAEFDAWVQKVRGTGVHLDAAALKALATPGTKAQLRAALPQATAPDGHVYFTGVKPGFFADLVMSVMDDTPLAPTALAPAPTGGQ
ncbi:MAG: Cytochrome O ubiquinol oxidase subunit II [Burkholderiaceae bacterium]|jgi:cytochrome o ubiquinol oxidase subunit 2|nr:MAG: Cytochrome O ubiquinol oxidase subunit II [Burkholderiaceae bacterium]